MTLEELLEKPLYNRKVWERFEHPQNRGVLVAKGGMPCVLGNSETKGIKVVLFALVDETDGIIADAKFQAIAPPLYLAALDVVCDLMLRKNYEQARRISPQLILKSLDVDCDLKLILNALEELCGACEKQNLPKTVVTPIAKKEGVITHDWSTLTHKEKLGLIENVIQEDVRPYIEMDEGGIEVLDLLNDRELIISYQGACTSCFSSIGSTLSSIQEIIQQKVHPEITVVPNIDNFNL